MVRQQIELKTDSQVQGFHLMFQPAGNGKLYVGSKRTGGFVLVKKYWEPIIVLLREPITVHDLARKLTRIDPKNFPADKSLSLTKLMLMKFVEHSLIENIGQAKILKTKRSKTILACPRWTGLLTRPYLVKFYVFLAFLALCSISFLFFLFIDFRI